MSLDEHSVARIILRERNEILAYINSFLNDPHLAEDCFQDVCAAAISKKQNFKEQTHLIRWTLAAARNKAIDAVRRRSRHAVVLDTDVLEILENQWTEKLDAHPSDSNSRSAVLTKCLSKLNDNNRKIVELRYFDGITSSRIAKLLGRNVEAVYKALTRIHTTLKTCVSRNLQASQNEGQKP